MRDVLVNMWMKTKAFVVEAGKIILLISMLLWFLGSYGPGGAMEEARTAAQEEAVQRGLNEMESEALVASQELRASFAGQLGQLIEPVIMPLGYDWKIGIALIASFAAREVFVGTIATIYSMEDGEDMKKLSDRLGSEINPRTGEPVFNLATSLSLLVFFLLAMQCMSTLAIVKRETGTWKWPMVQLVGMTVLAYISAFVVYQMLS